MTSNNENNININLHPSILQKCDSLVHEENVFDFNAIKHRYKTSKVLYEIRTSCYNLTTPPNPYNNPHWAAFRNYIIEKRGTELTWSTDANNDKVRTLRYKTEFQRYQSDASVFATLQRLQDDKE